MAVNSINRIKVTLQMRHGLEVDFDPDQMTVGEWAVSTDNRYVRICISPGICIRMATYEAFGEDMKKIQKILVECQDIQTAISAMVELAEQHKNDAEDFSEFSESWAHGDTGIRAGENTDNSKYYSIRSAENANLSKSWAIGEGGAREDEATNSSKFFAEQSSLSSEESKEYLEKVRQAGDEAVDKVNNALDVSAPDFLLDLETGNLLYSGGRFVFAVNNGNLEWGIAV